MPMLTMIEEARALSSSQAEEIWRELLTNTMVMSFKDAKLNLSRTVTVDPPDLDPGTAVPEAVQDVVRTVPNLNHVEIKVA